MSIAENIRKLRERYSLTQAELGEIAGVSDKAVSTWENGTAEPRMGAVQRIAEHFNITKGSIVDDSPTPTYEAAAGEGRICDSPTGEVDFRVDPDQVVVTVRGRSMEPTLMDGDLVVVEATSVAESPTRIYLVKVNGEEHTLKHVIMNDDGLTLTADNMSVFPPRLYTAQQVNDLPVTIEGVVVRLVRDMK